MTELSYEQKMHIVENLPPATDQICNDCPWRRNATPGWLGPQTAEEWLDIAHSEAPVACHQTIRGGGDWEDGRTRQCLGLAVFRANIGKRSRFPKVATAEPDKERVFSWDDEFLAYHYGDVEQP